MSIMKLMNRGAEFATLKSKMNKMQNIQSMEEIKQLINRVCYKFGEVKLGPLNVVTHSWVTPPKDPKMAQQIISDVLTDVRQ